MTPAESLQMPPGIRDLGPEAVDAVDRFVRARERSQDAELMAAFDSALKVAPRPLRGLVRKLLVG